MGKYGAGPLNLLEAAGLVVSPGIQEGRRQDTAGISQSFPGDQTCQGQGPG